MEACAKFCPDAIVGLATNPVNCLVPAMAQLYEKQGLSSNNIAGITTVDTVRSNKFVHEATGAPIEQINVPVIGGHDGKAIVPLLLQDPIAATIASDVRLKIDQQL